MYDRQSSFGSTVITLAVFFFAIGLMVAFPVLVKLWLVAIVGGSYYACAAVKDRQDRLAIALICVVIWAAIILTVESPMDRI